jgi:hypothetical protein
MQGASDSPVNWEMQTMSEERMRILLVERADRHAGGIDVDAAWADVMQRAAPVGGTPAGGTAVGRAPAGLRRRRAVLGAAAGLVLVTALAAALLVPRGAAPRGGGGAEPTTSVQQGPPALTYHPAAAVPRSFLAYVITRSQQQLIMRIATDGHAAAGLTVGAGLLYAQNRNGVLSAPDSSAVDFLDLLAPSPPGPGIGIYRVAGAGATPSLVAYGTDPAASTDGRFVAFVPDRSLVSDAAEAPVVGLAEANGDGRVDVRLATLFPAAHLGTDVVVGLVWLAGDDDLAVLLQAPDPRSSGTGACSYGFSPPSGYKPPNVKCFPLPPPATDVVAVLSVTRAGGSPAASGIATEQGPPHFAVAVAVPGATTGTVLLVGRSVRAGAVPFRVLLLAPLASPPTRLQVGELSAACEPMALDGPSGAVLCQSGSSIDVERVGTAGARRIPLPPGFLVGNAAW